MAADRQATHGAMGMLTVGQPITKIQLIGKNALFASSGHNGLGQQLAAQVDRRRGEFRNKPYHMAIREVQSDFRSTIEPAFRIAGLAVNILGPPATQEVICHSLLGGIFKDGLRLVEITPQCAVEEMGLDMPFISVGSGKACADTFLGLLRKVYWPAKAPSVSEGTLAAYWTVRHAIDMRIQGVGFEVDVFALEEKTSAARQLAAEELVDHGQFIAETESAMRDVSLCKFACNTDPLRGHFASNSDPLMCCVSVLLFGLDRPGRAGGDDWRGQDRRDTARLL